MDEKMEKLAEILMDMISVYTENKKLRAENAKLREMNRRQLAELIKIVNSKASECGR